MALTPRTEPIENYFDIFDEIGRWVREHVELLREIYLRFFCSAFTTNGVNLSLFRGQYAVVKRCREKATGKEFAAKFVRKRRKGKDCRAEVWHEVEVLNATNFPHQHPQIITLYDVFETRSEVILILELWVFLRRSRILFENFILRIERSVMLTLCVLSTAHSAGIYIGTASLTIATNLLRVEAKEKWCFYSDRFSKVSNTCTIRTTFI